jgi:hypothetical protein
MVTSRGASKLEMKYGLIQVRGKLSKGDGSWPAFWMLPNASWPGGGEFDLMESWNEDKASQTLHAGVCVKDRKEIEEHPGMGLEDLDPNACTSAGGTRVHLSKGEDIKYSKTPNGKSLFTNYHSYSLEWDTSALKFRTDGVLTNEIHEGDSFGRSHQSPRQWVSLDVHVPNRPFYMLLNQTVGDSNGGPNPFFLADQALSVDYVRAWQKCVSSTDYCPNGGSFNKGICTLNGKTYPSPCTKCLYGGSESGNNHCQVRSFASSVNSIPTPGVNFWVDTDPRWAGVFYKQVSGECNYGGSPSGNGNCVWKYFPQLHSGISYWVDTNPAWPGIYYKQNSGQCNHGGVASGNGNCQLLSFQLPNDGTVAMVPGVAYWVDADPRWPGVYYKQVNGTCRLGGTKSGDGNCQLTPIPAGELEDQVIYWADSNSRWPGIYYQQTY